MVSGGVVAALLDQRLHAGKPPALWRKPASGRPTCAGASSGQASNKPRIIQPNIAVRQSTAPWIAWGCLVMRVPRLFAALVLVATAVAPWGLGQGPSPKAVDHWAIRPPVKPAVPNVAHAPKG